VNCRKRELPSCWGEQSLIGYPVVGDMFISAKQLLMVGLVVLSELAMGQGPLLRKVLQPTSSEGEFGMYGSDICGDLLVVGSAFDRVDANGREGAVHVFRRDTGGPDNWGQIAQIDPPPDATSRAGFGFRVAVDRDLIAVGSFRGRLERADVHIYQVQGLRVTRLARIPDNVDDEEFGIDLDLFGNTLAVSAWNGGEGRTLNGRVHIYQAEVGRQNWVLQRTLTASATTLDDHYGWAVALSEDTLAVSAKDDWDGQRESGAVYLYERDLGGANRWGERQKLKANDIVRFGTFGSAVSLSGDTLAVGAHLTQNQTFVDYVFSRPRPGSSWRQNARNQFRLADSPRNRTQESISVSGDLLLSVDAETEFMSLRSRNKPRRGAWGLVQQTNAPPSRQFEQSIAISGDVIFASPNMVYEQPAVAPTIKHHPAGVSVRQGERAQFSVYPLGSRPLSVQWTRDGVAISGATETTLVIDVVGPNDPGDYQAVITNGFGQATSRVVGLESDAPATIVTQPTMAVREEDGSFRFQIEAGGADVQLQWLKNGVPIPGATNSILLLRDPQFGDAGVYSVHVSNALGAETSVEVELSLENMMPLQLAKFRPGEIGSLAGTSVDLFATFAIVGAPNAQPAGAAYVYQFQGQNGWVLAAELRPPGTGDGKFGRSVAINDMVAVVGAPESHHEDGAVYVFRRSSGGDGSGPDSSWGLEATLPPGPEMGNFSLRQGRSVEVSGGDIFVGSRQAIQQFTNQSDGQWVVRKTFHAPSAAAGFGNYLAVHNGVLVTGSDFDSTGGEFAGSAHVFEEHPPGSGEWSEGERLSAAPPSIGEHFGIGVAVHGQTIAIGAVPNRDGGQIGSVYIFERALDGWNLVQNLRASDEQILDAFGAMVALDNCQLLIGASGDDSRGSDSGAAYLFEKQGDSWQEVQKLQAFDAEPGNLFGISLVLESGNALVGSSRSEANGAAYLLRVSPSLLSVSSDGVPTFNPQTGLYEQRTVVRNLSTEAVPAMRLSLENIPEGVRLYNGTGGGEASIHFDHPIAGLATMEAVLEFFVPTRMTPASPLFSVATALAIDPPLTGGKALAIDVVRRTEAGGILIEFSSEPGRFYQIQYSTDMVNWNDAIPIVRAAGTRVFWHDLGPPKTSSPPAEDKSRWYRVISVAE
jgi:hypothetical protein